MLWRYICITRSEGCGQTVQHGLDYKKKHLLRHKIICANLQEQESICNYRNDCRNNEINDLANSTFSLWVASEVWYEQCMHMCRHILVGVVCWTNQQLKFCFMPVDYLVVVVVACCPCCFIYVLAFVRPQSCNTRCCCPC